MIVPAQAAYPDLDPDQHHILGVIWSFANGTYSFMNAWQAPLEPGAISATEDATLLAATQLFPNPASAGDVVRITLPQAVNGDILLTLLDASGRLVLEQHAQGPSAQLKLPASIADGSYFLRVSAGDVHQAFPVQVSR